MRSVKRDIERRSHQMASFIRLPSHSAIPENELLQMGYHQTCMFVSFRVNKPQALLFGWLDPWFCQP